MIDCIYSSKEKFPLSLAKRVENSYCKSFHGKLFTLAASSESQIPVFSRLFSPSYSTYLGFIKNEEAYWFLDESDVLKVRNWIIAECRTDNKKILGLYSDWEKNWKKYLQLNASFLSLELSSLSDKELYEKFKEYYTHYLLAGGAAYICDSFISTGETDWLEELLKNEIGDRLDAEKKMQSVRKLTSPVHRSFTLESEFRLLKIAENILGEFKNKIPEFKEIKNSSPDLYLQLKEHEKSFYWIKNNYFNVEYADAEHFYMQVKKTIEEFKTKNQIRNLIEEKESELKKLKNEREELSRHLGFSAFAKNILEVARLFSKWKDVRKSGVYMGMYVFDLFLGEVSKRKKCQKSDLTFLVFDEVKSLLLENKDFANEIKKRKGQLFYSITKDGKYFVCGGEDARDYFKLLNKKPDMDVIELKGVVASVGYARGRVRIIRKTSEMHDFITGEILVSNQTTPEFVPIMKKAAAIITEQGGVTSHAAVVSREMKKPCIIGTRIATSVLKNGEMVEVDANNGIIRRLK